MGGLWLRICALIWDFTCFWFVSFPWKRFARGMPFLLVLLFLLTSFCLLETSGSELRKRLLDSQLAHAFAADDWETARVVLHRQLRIAPDNRDAKFNLARTLYAMEEQDQARQLMHQLTFSDPDLDSNPPSEKSPGKDSVSARSLSNRARFRGADPRAGQWLLENVYLSRPWDELTDRDQQEVLDLLRWLNETMPDELQLQQRYAEHLLLAQRYHDALPVLAGLIPEAPGIGLQAGIIARSLGDSSRATEYAQHSLEQFAALAQQNPADPSAAVALARCQVFLEQYPEAVRTLELAIERSPDPDQRLALSPILAGALVAWATALEDKPEQTLQEQLQVLKNLQAALQHAPNDEKVIQIVANQILAAAEDEDPHVSLLRESLIHGTSPGISHFIRGTAAVMAGDDEKGKFHLEIAAKTLPNSNIVLNNLAHVMALQENADLDQALQISETAISQASPPTPYHLETRGQILFQMEQYADAIPDLEAGLSIPALQAAAHRSLAECYRHLGAADLSEQHRSAAEQPRSVAEQPRSVAEQPRSVAGRGDTATAAP